MTYLKSRSGFTLMEINLAIFVMAVGVLAMIALYPLGFREGDQSREDVAAAAYADAVLNPLVAVLSSTNLTWSAWTKNISCNSLRDYFNDSYFSQPKSLSAMSDAAKRAFDNIANLANAAGVTRPSYPTEAFKKLGCSLVVSREGRRILLAVRATRRPGMLLAQPLYYTEVYFQGNPNLDTSQGSGK